MDAATAKTTLRRRARELPPATADESAAVVDRLAALPVLATADRTCLYLAMAGEIDITDLAQRRPDAGWVTTRTGAGQLLTVHDLWAPRERHPFGFDQPVAGSPEVDPSTVDLWLVPGLAFDLDGNRLGNGAGYYDRLLALAAPASTRVGVTLERRLCPSGLPREPHDQVMDLVVTEAHTTTVA